jgi:hypothetical protein
MSEPCFMYELEPHGWAKTVFVLEGKRHEINHGWCENPLEPIAAVAVQLATSGGVSHKTALFDEEAAGYVEASFFGGDPTLVRLARFPSGVRPNGFMNQGEEFACGVVDSFELALDIAKALDHILRKYGVLGYSLEWQEYYLFPLVQYLRLRLLLDQSTLAQSLAGNPGPGRFAEEMRLLQTPPDWRSRMA